MKEIVAVLLTLAALAAALLLATLFVAYPIWIIPIGLIAAGCGLAWLGAKTSPPKIRWRFDLANGFRMAPVLLAVVALAFPPWCLCRTVTHTLIASESLGYAFVLHPPPVPRRDYGHFWVAIDWPRLAVQIAALATLYGAVSLMRRSRG